MLVAIFLLAFAGLLLFAAFSDIATMTIPNWVSLALAGLFVPAALLSGMTLASLGVHLAFGAGVLLVCFFLFQANILGGGDAKLIAAIALWTGGGAFAPFAFGTAIAGGALALTIYMARKWLSPSETRPAFLNRLLAPNGGVPYGVAIMVGGFAAITALPFGFTSLTMP